MPKKPSTLAIPVESRILILRHQRVILDSDLAELYGVTVKRLNQQVNRNQGRFPADFTFRLSAKEDQALRLQIATSKKGRGGRRYPPYAFTEHGVTMLASVLRSENAVKMSIEVVRAFIALKQFALQQNNIDTKFQHIEDRIGEHDVQLNHIYDAIEKLLDEKAAEKHWKDRERIGFKNRKV